MSQEQASDQFSSLLATVATTSLFHPLGGALYHKSPLREAQYIKVTAAWS